jgi:hypothetical protein
MANVAPHIPTALFVLGLISTVIGVGRLMCTALQFNVCDLPLLLPWGIAGGAFWMGAMMFSFFESCWWFSLSLNAQRRLLQLPPLKIATPPQAPRPFGPLAEV